MNERILVVDDDAGVAEVLRMFLEDKGFHIKTLSCAEDAIALPASESFDLILLDNVLPGMTGLRAIAHLKGRAPIVLMTGHCDDETRKDALTLGAATVMSKPIDLKTFEGFLQGILKD